MMNTRLKDRSETYYTMIHASMNNLKFSKIIRSFEAERQQEIYSYHFSEEFGGYTKEKNVNDKCCWWQVVFSFLKTARSTLALDPKNFLPNTLQTDLFTYPPLFLGGHQTNVKLSADTRWAQHTAQNSRTQETLLLRPPEELGLQICAILPGFLRL